MQNVTDTFIPQLGAVYTDKVTGFTGTAVNRVHYMVRSSQLGLLPRSKEPNKLEEAEFFDFQRLTLAEETTVVITAGVDTKPFKFSFGDEVQDPMTGVKGTVIAVCEHLDGCITFGVVGKADKDGKPPSTNYISEHSLKLVKAAKPVEPRRTGATHHHDLPPRNGI